MTFTKSHRGPYLRGLQIQYKKEEIQKQRDLKLSCMILRLNCRCRVSASAHWRFKTFFKSYSAFLQLFSPFLKFCSWKSFVFYLHCCAAIHLYLYIYKGESIYLYTYMYMFTYICIISALLSKYQSKNVGMHDMTLINTQ